LVRQENTGPAGARNRGFAAATGDLVLFMDDDILATPEMLSQHVDAQRAHQGSVISGSCPFLAPDNHCASKALIDLLEFEPGSAEGPSFIPVPVMASGQVSVSRSVFQESETVYGNDLRTPAAEEFELSYRLRQLGIPILHAPHIIGFHDCGRELKTLCVQQEKHGKGCAEAAVKYPETLNIQLLSNVIRQNGPLSWRDPVPTLVKKMSKSLFANNVSRTILLRMFETILRLLGPRVNVLRAVRFLVGLYFFAGVREGIQVYGASTLQQDGWR